jgi:hypothetical protein
MFPTGETHPKGTFFFTDYDVIGLELGYALTDRFELELTAIVPFLVDAALKLNFVRTDWVRVATFAAMDVPTLDLGPPVFRAGLAGQLCFSKQCWSSLSLSGMGGAGRTDLLPKRYGFAGAAGAIFALSRVVKVLVEPILTWVPGDSSASELQWGAGLRIAREQWGLDLGFEYVTGNTEYLPIVPLIAFTWRTLGERP